MGTCVMRPNDTRPCETTRRHGPRFGRSPATRLLYCVLFLVLGVGPVSVRADGASRSEEVWKEFRTAYPLHIQTIGLSGPKDGKRVLIIAEPPPHVVLEKLKELDPAAFKQPAVRSHTIGTGGFVKDIVVELPVDPYDGRRLDEFLARLGSLLYHTSYKLPIRDLDEVGSRPAAQRPALDLDVTAAELRDWLLRDEKPFPLYPLGAQRAITAAAVFKAAPATSFVATTLPPGSAAESGSAPGLVTWWVPIGKDMEAWRVEARQFTLEADLIVGALFEKGKGVLFVGRARRATYAQLPPLRVETLLLLSRVDDESLAQSFERNHPMVYLRPDGRHWAPAYLSPQLVDTEFGSLLNVADQLLKRWSNNGEVAYDNFSYKDPAKWGFKEPLGVTFVIKKRARELTFNWNTHGAGYTLPGEAIGVFAMTRTGSLPVSY